MGRVAVVIPAVPAQAIPRMQNAFASTAKTVYGWLMKRLSEVVEALRREIEAGFRSGSIDGGSPIRSTRVSVSIPWQWTEIPNHATGGAPQTVAIAQDPSSTPPPSGQVLSLEFWIGEKPEVAHPAELAAVSTSSERPPVAPNISTPPTWDPEIVTGSISEVLGPPGFDSAARATVLHEALESFQPAQIRESLVDLHKPGSTTEDPEIKRARHRLRGILVSGPMHHAGKGGEALIGLFESFGKEAILRLVRERWKTQQAWLDETP